MLLAYNNPQFVEKIFTDQTGRQFRLTFLVAMVGGELKGRLVSAQLISARLRLAGIGKVTPCSPFILPIFCKENKTETPYIPFYTPVVSPFNELFFFNSQPTRAPSSK